ncbi:Glycosyl transferase, group 2 protein [Pseudomonas savastanoi pv. glycinea]|nr:Glycosyl transferase, group 2 protein [Pseudomonas savastanoi pv. glycinea]
MRPDRRMYRRAEPGTEPRRIVARCGSGRRTGSAAVRSTRTGRSGSRSITDQHITYFIESGMMSEQILGKSDPTGKPISTACFSGTITGLYGDVLQGWALDTQQPDERLAVEVYIDGACVSLVRADQFHPNAGAGDPFHGFGVQLRQSWLEDAKHISARWPIAVTGLPVTCICPLRPAKSMHRSRLRSGTAVVCGSAAGHGTRMRRNVMCTSPSAKAAGYLARLLAIPITRHWFIAPPATTASVLICLGNWPTANCILWTSKTISDIRFPAAR